MWNPSVRYGVFGSSDGMVVGMPEDGSMIDKDSVDVEVGLKVEIIWHLERFKLPPVA